MSEKIKPITVQGKGIATEILYEYYSRFARDQEATVYYHLRDTSQSTSAFDMRNGQTVTLPYKIVYSEKLRIIGSELDILKQDPKYAKDIALVRSFAEIDTSKYFVIVNKVSRIGRLYGTNPRESIDGNAYELYEKPSSLNTGLNNYRLLDSYIGDPQGKVQLAYSNGMYLTNVEVSFEKEGIPNYIVDQNSKGDAYYIKKVQPYI